jgi:prophage tail gpP-like protein
MAPHPVTLTMQNPPQSASKPFANLSVQYGETVAEFIERIAMMRGLFFVGR